MMLYLNSVMFGLCLAALQILLGRFSMATFVVLVGATLLAILLHMFIQRKMMEKVFRSC